jgi:hypothetical protein
MGAFVRSKTKPGSSPQKVGVRFQKSRARLRPRTRPPRQESDYGIYTVGDHNFFAGVVAAINSLRHHGYRGSVVVFDVGFDPWMVEYLRRYDRVEVLEMESVGRNLRFTDVVSDECPLFKDWAYKAFGIVHYDRFRHWTFIDGDYLPLCNLEDELLPLIKEGCFIGTEDGINEWNEAHEDAMGVRPGTYLNINAGFVSVNMETHGHIVHEWRNLMTRFKPFALWWGDQGALNAILDKHGVERTLLDRRLWNQTGMNTSMTEEGACRLVTRRGHRHVIDTETGVRVMGWHGVGWHKLWHQIGIDHYRENASERRAFRRECRGKSPPAVVELFRHFLFSDRFNRRLRQNGHRLE